MVKHAMWTLTWRSIRTSAGRWAAILLIVFLSVGFYCGLTVCRPQFWQACENYLDSRHFYDFRMISPLGFSSDDVDGMAGVSGVLEAEGQKSTDASVSYGERSGIFEIRALPEKINLPSVVAGRLPEREDECAVDHRAFSDAAIGGTVTVSEDAKGLKNRSLTVVGTVNSPLYLNSSRGTTALGSGVRDGFLYITEDLFAADYFTELDLILEDSGSWPIYSDGYQNLVDSHKDAVSDKLDERVSVRYGELAGMIGSGAAEAAGSGSGVPSAYLLTREENEGYVSFRSDTSIISAIAGIFPLFFILIALLVCVTTMTRMIGEERIQIGTLKALGYQSASITMKYMLYAGSATALGWAAGFVAGTYAIPRGFWAAYSTLYDFSDLPYAADPALAVLTLAVSLAAITGSVWISCRSGLLSSPADLIRPRSAKPGSRILLERFTPLWNRLSFLQKAILRNMLRYKVRTVMMLIGIGCCTALVVTAFGVRDSMIHVGDIQYDEIQTYDLSVSIDGGKAETVEKEISGLGGDRIRGMIPAFCENVTVSGQSTASDGAKMNSVTLMSFEKGTDLSGYWKFTDWDGKKILSLPEEGSALVSRRLARKLGLKEGDKIRVEDGAAAGGDTDSAVLTVGGVYRNYIGNFVFIAPETCKQYFSDEGNSGAENTLLIRTAGAPDGGLTEEINDISGVSGVSSLAESRKEVNRSLDCLNYIIWLIVLFSGALAFIVIFNLTNINLAERSREIATVEVLGFYPRETRHYILSENLMISVIAGIIGLPPGYLFTGFVIRRILIDQMTFRITVEPVSYLMAFCCTVLFVLIVNFFMRRRIASIDMAESLKAVE
ncbi:MAG: ABC transporter permease [Lachnospiraceae bacterium]|jgi:putative ABC transport system permease protein|nr:ABC transporter permease [Lachnospiraceae bacterium]MCI1328981.1 ABC transporter permease [Lachnospiraceae bacterium]